MDMWIITLGHSFGFNYPHITQALILGLSFGQSLLWFSSLSLYIDTNQSIKTAIEADALALKNNCI